MRGWLACHPPPPPSHKGDKLSHFKAEINCHIFYLHPPSLSWSGTDTEFQTDRFCSTRVVPQGGVGGMNGFELQAEADHADIFLIFYSKHRFRVHYMLDPPY